MAQKNQKGDRFRDLTWDHLHAWAGSKIVFRGQNYQRSRLVQGLARTPSGGLAAWVQGTERYATRVELEGGELTSVCTCPYAGTCKHAVAVVLEYLERAKKDFQVPIIPDQDKRLSLLAEAISEEDWDEEETDEEEWDEGDEEDDLESHGRFRPKKAAPSSLLTFLEKQTKEQLVALIQDLAERFPAVLEALQDQGELSKGHVKRMISSIKKEIRDLSAKPGWRNYWNGEGYTPDFSRVKERMEGLLARGYADEVVALGKELLEAGKRQVEMSQDEGESGMEISSCLDVVFRAMTQSSLPPLEQMLWVIEAELGDEYDLCHGAEIFWKRKHKASDWSLLADKLLERLNHFPVGKKEDSFSRNYRRDGLSKWVIHALENAGRKEEIIPLCQREAEITGNYPRLVQYLIKASQFQEAEQWIHKGMKATRGTWPGIASELRRALQGMREKKGNWLQVAAFKAEDFFLAPTLDTFQELQKAAKRAKVWPEVRAAAMNYLETGNRPKGDTSWPLPETGVLKVDERRQKQFPVIAPLIDIAIAEKRPDEVIRWYDQHKPKRSYWEWYESRDDQVASAVAEHYPDRALEIWKNLAEDQIALTKPKAYDEAAAHLKKVHRLLKKLDREKEWESYINKIRRVNERKRKLLEILSRLEGRRIIEG
jgi:uncharacterized Zn finger protein